MVTGYQIRMNRILKNGKMLCIPMDHGISSGPLKGIEDPYPLIYNCHIGAHVSRSGAECSAHIVKTLHSGDVDSFAKVVNSTPVPVVIAGGPKANTDMDVLQMTEEAMQAGAKGVTYGRNIFEHKDPPKMTHALAAIIFRKETAKEAAKYLEQE